MKIIIRYEKWAELDMNYILSSKKTDCLVTRSVIKVVTMSDNEYTEGPSSSMPKRVPASKTATTQITTATAKSLQAAKSSKVSNVPQSKKRTAPQEEKVEKKKPKTEQPNNEKPVNNESKADQVNIEEKVPEATSDWNWEVPEDNLHEISVSQLSTANSKSLDQYVILVCCDTSNNPRIQTYVDKKSGLTREIFKAKLQSTKGFPISLECFGDSSTSKKKSLCERLKQQFQPNGVYRLWYFDVKTLRPDDYKWGCEQREKYKLCFVFDDRDKLKKRFTIVDELEMDDNQEIVIERPRMDFMSSIDLIPEFVDQALNGPKTESTIVMKNGNRMVPKYNIVAMVFEQEPKRIIKTGSVCCDVILVDDSNHAIKWTLWGDETKKNYMKGSLLVLKDVMTTKHEKYGIQLKSGSASLVNLNEVDENNDRVEDMRLWSIRNAGFSDRDIVKNLSRPEQKDSADTKTNSTPIFIEHLMGFREEAMCMISQAYQDGILQPNQSLPRELSTRMPNGIFKIVGKITGLSVRESNNKNHKPEDSSIFYPTCTDSQRHPQFHPRVKRENNRWICPSEKCGKQSDECDYATSVLLEITDGFNVMQIACFQLYEVLRWFLPEVEIDFKKLLLEARLNDGIDMNSSLDIQDHIESKYGGVVRVALEKLLLSDTRLADITVEVKPDTVDGVQYLFHSIRDVELQEANEWIHEWM